MKRIKITINLCTGCNQCVLTCAFSKTSVFDITQSNIKIVQWEDLCLSVPLVCRQCSDAPCIDVCPSTAIAFGETTGAIQFDLDLCSSCGLCIEACRYQVIHFNHNGNPETCDFCNGDPKCVQSCFPGALKFEDCTDQIEPLANIAETLIERLKGGLEPPPASLIDLAILPPYIPK